MDTLWTSEYETKSERVKIKSNSLTHLTTHLEQCRRLSESE